MHDTSFTLMSRFVEAYLGDRESAVARVIDVCSRTTEERSAWRALFPPAHWRYQALGLAAGENVDIVVDDPYRWNAIEDATVDLVVSAHALNHFEYPWDLMRETARVLRPGGLVCLLVPSAGPALHDSQDCWRVYPDGLRALAKHAVLRAVEVFTAWGLDEWQDTFAVLQKPRGPGYGLRPAFPEAFDQGVARRVYLESFGTRPQDATYYLNVARIMFDGGSLGKAAAALKIGLEVVPRHPELRRMLGQVEDLATRSTPALDRAIAALGARPLTINEVGAAADFFEHASAAERRLLVRSQQGDTLALRKIATLADDAQRFGLAALCWEHLILGNSGRIADLLSWALSSRGAGALDTADRLFRQARDLQLKSGKVTRTTVVQRLIWKRQAASYLEIGVARGTNLLQIEVARKYAVDPDFRIPGGTNDVDGTSFHPVTSDAFFRAPPSEIVERALDVVLVDGLHTAKQALRDIENALRFLKPRGVIVVHDCLPASEAQACGELEQAQKIAGFDGAWTGDVYKSIVRLRATRKDLFVCVLDTDHGVGIVTRGRPENPLSLGESEIDAMTFAQLRAAPEALLNLKPPAWFEAWLVATP